jgi:hypothetical protein
VAEHFSMPCVKLEQVIVGISFFYAHVKLDHFMSPRIYPRQRQCKFHAKN